MTPDRRRLWLGRALPWALLILLALRGLAAMRADGTTADEHLHLGYGERGLKLGTFVRPDSLLNSKMPVSMLNALPEILANRDGTLSWKRTLFIARLPSLLLGVLLGWLVWSWARALFGLRGGALALLLYTFCPTVLAHDHLVTTDISTALAMLSASYALWRYLDRPGRGRLLVAVAAFGLAQLTKTTAVFLFPIFALILALRLRSRKDLLRAAGLLLLMGLGALVILNAGFLGEGTGTPLKGYAHKGYTFASPGFQSLAATPILRDLPLPLPYPYVQGLDMVSHDSLAPYWTYLRGSYSSTGFRSYFLWAFLVKVPVATQLLLLLALGLWASGRLRAPGADDFLLVPVVFLLVYFSLFFRLGIGVRYILPVFPFLFVFAGRVAAFRPSSAGWRRWQPAVVGALACWLAVSSLSVHPRYLSYFNEIAGGPANGWRWLLDSNIDWGQDDEYVHNVYVLRSPVPVKLNPSGPTPGRIAVDLNHLIGTDPGAGERYAWLRENFRPVAKIRQSWWVFDVTEAGLARCCAGTTSRPVEDPEVDLALLGQPVAGADGARVRFVERLNDGSLGTNDPSDAARTLPPRPHPVRAWFGVLWPGPRTVGRVVAYPGFNSLGPETRKLLALDYVFQAWDGMEWRDIPGTRVVGNQELRVEHRFPTLRARGIRLLIERERNASGVEAPDGGFRAACLEIAAYER